MKSRPLVSSLMLILVASFAAQANAAPKDPKPFAARGLDLVSKALEKVTDLSEQQKTDTKATLADAEAQLVALRDEAKSKGKQVDKDARKELRQKAMEIIFSARNQIESQLTDAQKKTFREAIKTARQDATTKRQEKGDKKDKSNPV